MIGRFDSTEDRRRARHPSGAAHPALLLAIAGLIAVGGSASTSFAQAPKAQVKGVVPASDPGRPGEMPDLGSSAPPSPLPGNDVPPEMGTPPPIPRGAEAMRPRRDAQVRPAEADEANPGLPPALVPDGGSPPPSGGTPGAGPDPFVLPSDRLNVGKQRVQLTVEVLASQFINVGKESEVRIVVRNESNVDASGVSVVYQLPDALKLISSTPDATQVPADSKALYHWAKPMLATGSEWTIILRVKATSAKSCDHAATVTAKTGSRATSTVQEPKLKVEATATKGRVLKGEQVHFQIAVHNPGTGPARNVIVQAKLSAGLRSGSDDIVEQTISEIAPGQRVELEPLTVDTIAGGQQTCTVDVRSDDVNPVIEDQRVARSVDVTEPKLAVKITGDEYRFTGQTTEYKMAITNPGTAPAKQVKVSVSLPTTGGKLLLLPANAKFAKETRKLFWTIGQLEPGQTVEMSFPYGTSTPGLYKATAEATSGELRALDTMTTDVSGLAVLDLQITQPATGRVIDKGKKTFYDITIKNSGTKEATKLQLSGKLVGNLKILRHFGVDQGKFVFKEDGDDKGRFIFPEIDRLAVGQTITLSLEVQATDSGPAGCHVYLAHAEMAPGDAPTEDVISTTVTGNNRPSTAAAKRP